jgi:hypothetical protein
VKAVLERLQTLGYPFVEELRVVDEDVRFALPRELQLDGAQAVSGP